jgi:AraC family transcriptional regulator, transcriptional activator of pobA
MTASNRPDRSLQLPRLGFERYFLYGELPRPVSERFVHLEYLDERSRPANWIIRPHAHAELHHVFYLEAGGGAGEGDSVRFSFAAPCIIVVPAGVVHGFRWREESEGRVLTFSAALAREALARAPEAASALSAGMWLGGASPALSGAMLTALARELAWAAVGTDAVIEACLTALLVDVARAREACVMHPGASASGHVVLAARCRELIETRFREQPSVADLASELHVSVSRLRSACRLGAGASPQRMLHDRTLLEARRLMRYSNMNVSQIAHYLGFADPAYFSRFFARETGRSPRTFRDGLASGRDGFA